MKIGFIGAGGTGKTTTAVALSEVTGLPFHQSTTRGVFAKYGKSQLDLEVISPELRWTIQRENFLAKLDHDQTHREGIFDRTLLDHLMYCLIYCHDVMSDDDYRLMVGQVNNNIQTFDKLFYFPIYDWPPPADGFREIKLANRVLQDKILVGFLGSCFYPHVVMDDVSAEQRVRSIQALGTGRLTISIG